MITCSKGIYLQSSPVDVTTNLAKFDGTLTLAKSSIPVSGFLTMTARLSESPEIYGKGCDGSIASGVRTGKICLLKISIATSRSLEFNSSQRTILIPSLESFKWTSSWKHLVLREISSSVLVESSFINSIGVNPAVLAFEIPVSNLFFSEATRIM